MKDGRNPGIRDRHAPPRWIAMCALALTWALTGCATGQYRGSFGAEDPFEVGQLLQRAGFQVRSANTAEELERLATMDQRTFISEVYKGSLAYLYADAAYCKCLYVGTAETYARYLELASQARRKREQRDAARWRQLRGEDFTATGSPWGPNP
jgi:hypothetical protein